MRVRGAAFALIVFAVVCTICLGIAGAQTPASAKQTAAPKTAAASPRPVQANLAQLMRGILLPASNIIFFAQGNNPADVKPAADPSSATDPLASTYGGWTAVENSALALTEAARLLTVPGRVCSNGRPVPVMNADWTKFVQGLRAAGVDAYKAAQTKNQDKLLDAAGNVSTACQNCHDVYREKTDAQGGLASRCTK
jgi:hypothetical protein